MEKIQKKINTDPFGFLKDSINDTYKTKEEAYRRLEGAESQGDEKAIKKEKKVIKEIDAAITDLDELINAMIQGNLAKAGTLLVKYQAKIGKDILTKGRGK